MGSNCCCCAWWPFPEALDHSSARRNDPQPYFFSQRSASTCTCHYCHQYVDPALLDGHQEVCRHRQHLGGPTSVPNEERRSCSSSSESLAQDDELCVVCLQRHRRYAFLPCGHVACCRGCALQLDMCPLCRGPRTNLWKVDTKSLSKYKCRSCGLCIAPTFFDGHREVCAIQLRNREAEKLISSPPAYEGEATNITVPDESEPAMQVGTTRPSEANFQCLECLNKYESLVVCFPCGHRVMCSQCAKKRITCPICLTEIQETRDVFM